MNATTALRYQYAFLDSGTGGLPYLAQLKARAPTASYVYLADTAHFPYGEKTRDEVIEFAVSAVGRLLDRFSPDLVVVACNTISVAALAALREAFGIPFVGTVPAIKLAAAVSENRRIGLLATERTVRDPYTDGLIRDFAADCHVERVGDSTLVSQIERELVTAGREERLRAVRPSIDHFRAAGVDTIVLACTHFVHVRDEIDEAAGPGIKVIDSRDGVVQQALRVVPPRPDGNGSGAFYVTGGLPPGAEDRYREYADLFGVSWGGSL